MTNKKKKLGTMIAALVLVLCTVGGTAAFLTKQNVLTNKFIVGDFSTPKTKPGQPGVALPEEEETNAGRLNGNLYEPDWNMETARLIPGTSVVKNPYVGIGPNSEGAYVIMKVSSNLRKVGFQVDTNVWEPVHVDSNRTETVKMEVNGQAMDVYTHGMFRYIGGLAATDGKTTRWTSKPLFEKVVIDDSASSEDLHPMVTSESENGPVTTDLEQAIYVQAFLHQMYPAGDSSQEPIPDIVALSAGIKVLNEWEAEHVVTRTN